MKTSGIFALWIGSALLLSSSAIAGNTNKKSLRLTDTLTIQGKQVKPGQYTVEWDGAGPDVQLNIVKGNKTVATASAHIVPAQAAYKQDGYTTLAEKDGSRTLTQFFFRGEKFDLELVEAANAAGSSSKTTSPAN